MVKDNRTRSYTGYYCILSTTRAFIHLSAGCFAQGAALVANALQFSLSVEQNNKSAGYIKQIILVEAPL
jgi:hypothetical protein